MAEAADEGGPDRGVVRAPTLARRSTQASGRVGRVARTVLFVAVLAGVVTAAVLVSGSSHPGIARAARAETLGSTDASVPATTDPPTTTTTTSAALPPALPSTSLATTGAVTPRDVTPDTAATSTTTTTTTSAAPAAAGGDCGGQPTTEVDGQTWVCTFDDEFTGTSLDTSKWQVQQTATSGYHSGEECFEDSPDNVSVSGGTLNLTVREVSAPFTCQAFPPYQTQYTSGEVTSYQRFSQAFGLFEVRAKTSDPTAAGLQTSFWLYPENLTYGPWPDSGEIDVAELYSEYPDLAIPYVHYNNSDSDPDATNDSCVIGDPTQFHTYAVEWTPYSLTFLYDGRTCLVDRWQPAAPQSAPEPFDQPFDINLTQCLGIGTNQFVPGVTPLPATTSVEWVRVWGLSSSSS